ncbi:adaptor protein NBP2 SCDLUD_001787 [Saccharomycodes ludwigii]|uniref:adaptor protein NBP2 n=1 Tax=Saccharomycodes ludwigii TaxID=36035 RepID=UPI001E8419F5|nr:hypothetical protein SCDLUD_001787 [Saccharomycodes ludwigii]KAH3901999.1 hypothetical protein SCDLUD_001787 [Saccharomycodes ludwigii]
MSNSNHTYQHVNTNVTTTNSETNANHISTDPATEEEQLNNNHNSSEDYSTSTGYISVKDFAYDESHPLHYGYYEEDDNNSSDNENKYADDDYANDSYQEYSLVNGSFIGPNNNSILDNVDYDEDEENNSEWDTNKRQSIILPEEYIINKRAIALYDFESENDNELALQEGDMIFIDYKHGQGWLVAESFDGKRTGLVPEAYVSILEDNTEQHTNNGNDAKRPGFLTSLLTENSINTDIIQQHENNSDNSDNNDDDEYDDVNDDYDYEDEDEDVATNSNKLTTGFINKVEQIKL